MTSTRIKRARPLVLLVVALVFVAPVLAFDRFTDVGPGVHHDDISAIAAAGITAGCNPPDNTMYCPGDAVRRDQMATFMRRGFGRVAFADSANYVDLGDGAEHDLASVTILTGGVPGGTGFLKVEGTGHAFQSAGSAGPVRFRLWIARSGTSQISIGGYETLTPTAAGQPNPNGSAAVTWVFTVPTATSETIIVRGQRDWATATTNPLSGWGQLTATYIPFGSTGGSTAGTTTTPTEVTENRP
jgi:hypothetical protein